MKWIYICPEYIDFLKPTVPSCSSMLLFWRCGQDLSVSPRHFSVLPCCFASSCVKRGLENVRHTDRPTDCKQSKRSCLTARHDTTTTTVDKKRHPCAGVPGAAMSPPAHTAACLGLILAVWRGKRKRSVQTSPSLYTSMTIFSPYKNILSSLLVNCVVSSRSYRMASSMLTRAHNWNRSTGMPFAKLKSFQIKGTSPENCICHYLTDNAALYIYNNIFIKKERKKV